MDTASIDSVEDMASHPLYKESKSTIQDLKK
jgi:hypothetical protein